MVVSICQTSVIFEEKNTNIINAEEYIEKSSARGAALVLFPEMSFTGYTMEPWKVCERPENNYTMEKMKAYAVRYGVNIGFGYILKKNEKFYNRYAVVSPDKAVLCDYAKIHPFSYAGEELVYSSGEEICTFELLGMNICPFICYDLRFPEIFQAASEHAEVFIVAANWGGARNAHWRLLLQARALENQSFVIGVNRTGKDPVVDYVGNSLVAAPDGQILESLDEQEGMMLVEICKDAATDFRKNFPVKKDRKNGLYKGLL